MRKNDRYHGRISAEMKGRWMSEATRLGYRTLSDFIEDTMEQVHFPVPEGVVPESFEQQVATAVPEAVLEQDSSGGDALSYEHEATLERPTADSGPVPGESPLVISRAGCSRRSPRIRSGHGNEDVQGVRAPEGLSSVESQVREPGDAAPERGSVVAGTGSPDVCPSAAKHRIGIWCKGCKVVIR